MTMSLPWTRGRMLGAAGITVVLLAIVASSAQATADNDGPQATVRADAAVAGDFAEDLCEFLVQLNPDEQKYRNTNNMHFTYDVGVYGTDWFDVACGYLTFTVPKGKTALVDLTAVAELDCQSKEGPVGGWCGGRFLINGEPSPHPDNTGRSDTYAWDSANGGSDDWSAHTLAQEYVAVCERPANDGLCYYRVQLQSQLENGATSVWIDDLTIRVDVSEGDVKVDHGSPTP
jgi:hypothetical protein